MSVSDSHLRSLLDEQFPWVMEQLTNLVAIPSVSWPAFDQRNVVKSAHSVAELARSLILFESVEILQAATAGGTLGNPAVVARRNAAEGFPTILLYAHHDVQPPGDEALWNTKPFVATEVDGRLYGRGAADDKAGVMLHISSLRAATQLLEETNFGIVLFVEGEEEYGSPSFTQFLNENKQLLQSDVIVVADSGNWDTTTPALTTTLRGNVTFALEITTLDHALHSGMFGGLVPDSFMVFAKLVESFYDEHGSVCIEGLSAVTSNSLEHSDQQLRDESGILSEVEFIGAGNRLSRLWSQPSLTVTGIDFPSVENASNTLTPHLRARISVRIAPDQSASSAFDAISQHIATHVAYGAHYSISQVSMGEGFSAATANWAYTCMADSLEQAFAKPAVDMGVGGSIPFIAEFVTHFPAAHVLVTGVEDPDSRAHSPNESLDIASYRKAIEAQTRFFLEMNTSTVHTQE